MVHNQNQMFHCKFMDQPIMLYNTRSKFAINLFMTAIFFGQRIKNKFAIRANRQNNNLKYTLYVMKML